MSVTWFDSLTLSLCLACILAYKSNRDDSVFLALSMAVYMYIAAIDLSSMAENYLLLVISIEFIFVFLGLAIKTKSSILIIFLISIVYNTITFAEFKTDYASFHSNYEIVMQGLILLLLSINLKNGIEDGTSNDHNNSGHTDNIGYSRFFRWGSP